MPLESRDLNSLHPRIAEKMAVAVQWWIRHKSVLGVFTRRHVVVDEGDVVVGDEGEVDTVAEWEGEGRR